jgi:protein-L-isoaspartate(D-aspartate) O-methyltransferase
MRHSIEEARQHYAEELRFTAKLGSRVIVDAFATVPRERFLGPGPWRVLSPMAMAEYWTTQDADPRHLYHDVLIAIDEERRLNNGQPSLWARMYDHLELSRGEHVVHVGAGTGYYSAILAQIVGRAGRVTAIEVDPILAARAKESLAAAWPQAAVFAADGFHFPPGSASRRHRSQRRGDAFFCCLARCVSDREWPPAHPADQCRTVGLLPDDHPPGR